MNKVNIFQIYYNQDIVSNLDPGFSPMNNMGNERPDWREYWPIRNYLISNRLNDEDYYGFFSPKFRSKTGLSANDCYEFIDANPDNVDVFIFSPFFDVGAWHQNSFLQAVTQHPNSHEAFEGALKILNKDTSINEIVMHSGNIAFCNFFVAKPKFWLAWFKNCELIFAEAEERLTPIGLALNLPAEKHHSNAPIKTFVIERIASLMLATECCWNSKVFNPITLPLAPTWMARELNALIQLDALKIAHSLSCRGEYLELFNKIRNLMLDSRN